ncbi:MAG: hypothetical protein RLO52_08350 [Sandaracinaceae bacterium]
MRIRLNADGRVLQGTPVQIVQAMHAIAFGADGLSLSEYIDWACEHAARMVDVHLEIPEGTEEERAASFVDAMVGAHLAVRL